MVSLADVEAARTRLEGRILLTSLTQSESFRDLIPARPWFKFENLQRTGSFKERGALNRMLLLSPEERARGVIAASAGNHAQGVAYHAAQLGIDATIVMPERTPLIKVSNTERLGARVVLHGHSYDEAQEETLRLVDSEGQILIHPFDDPAVIAGQGTIALEVLDQFPGIDVVVVALGGGGLISGMAVALKELAPHVRVIGVEAETLPAAIRALEAGRLVTIPPGETIADGIAVRRIGNLTFPLIEKYVDDVVCVSEEEIASSVLLLLEREKTVVEPAAAATLAAVAFGKVKGIEGKDVAMILSGGNIDVNLLSRIIDRGLINDGRLAQMEVTVLDRPGALAALTALVARQGANILRLDHRRGTAALRITEAEVDLTLETRGRSHVDELAAALRTAGYRVRRH
ncbi:MAG TPA: threonine ammonia-lyase [Longimicrobiaceae bacterium]